MGVRSCGWIMESTEGRWPSLDPTKNSLWTEKQVVGLITEHPSRGLLVSLTHSAGNGELRGLLTCSPLPLGNEPMSLQGHSSCVTSGQGRVPGSFTSVLHGCLYITQYNRQTQPLKLTLKSSMQHWPPAQPPFRSCPSSPRAECGSVVLGGSPGGREEGPVDGAEAGQAHKDGDDPGHDAQVVVPEVLDRCRT